MGFLELFILAVGLAMDAFAVSICKGLTLKRADGVSMAKCGLWFGGFQAIMPLIGFLLGSLFASAIEAVDHWVAFALLAFIGANMLKEAFSKKCDECEEHNADLSFKTMFLLAIATSIDAAAVGVSLAMEQANIWLAISLIGVVTFAMCAAGVKIGNLFGSRYEKKAQAVGGFILIGLAVKFLVEGLLENFF